MKRGECWCNGEEPVTVLWDENHEPVFKIDGEGFLRIRIAPEQGVTGLPIEFCPYCGRKLADRKPRCPEGLRQK